MWRKQSKKQRRCDWMVTVQCDRCPLSTHQWTFRKPKINAGKINNWCLWLESIFHQGLFSCVAFNVITGSLVFLNRCKTEHSNFFNLNVIAHLQTKSTTATPRDRFLCDTNFLISTCSYSSSAYPPVVQICSIIILIIIIINHGLPVCTVA